MASNAAPDAAVAYSSSAFKLVDDQGNLRAALSMKGAEPALVFYDTAQRERLSLKVSADGCPQVFLLDGISVDPVLKIEGDPFGSHVLLSGRGDQKTYLFLKSTGASGLVMINASGQRQAEWTLTPDGLVSWSLWAPDGSLLASSSPPSPAA